MYIITVSTQGGVSVSVRTASSAEDTRGSASPSLDQLPSFSTVAQIKKLQSNNRSPSSTSSSKPSMKERKQKYLVRMRLPTGASLHWNITGIQASHACLRRCTEGRHVRTSRHSWHTNHGLLHLSWKGSRYHRLTAGRCIP